MENLNNFFEKNYNKLFKKYRKYCDSDNETSEILTEIWEKLNKSELKINNINQYISTYFYNKTQRFFAEKVKKNYLKKYRNLSIKSESNISCKQDKDKINNFYKNYVEETDKNDINLSEIIEFLIQEKLTTDEKELYYLVYQSNNGKGMSLKDVGLAYGYNYLALQKIHKPMKLKIKNLLIEYLKNNNWNENYINKLISSSKL